MMGDIESMCVGKGDNIICVNDSVKRHHVNYCTKKLKNITKNKLYTVIDTKEVYYINPKNNKRQYRVKFIKILGDLNKECWVVPIRFQAQEEKVINYIREKRLDDILKNDLVEI